MVTVGGRFLRPSAYCKDFQRCKLRLLSNEAAWRISQGSESKCFSSSRAHGTSAKVLSSSSQWNQSLHKYSTCCSNGSVSNITKNNYYLKQRLHQRIRASLKTLCHSSQFLPYFSRNLLTGAAPSTFKEDNIDSDEMHTERRTNPMEIDELVEYLHQENAIDVCVISVPPSLDYVDYFVVCSGFGTRHLRKMADGLVAELKSVRIGRNNRRVRVEGADCDDWMAIEMGTIVVHFMTEEARSKYELEKLWTLGPHYDDQYRGMEQILDNNP